MGTWSRDYFSRNSWHIFSGQIMQGEEGGEMMGEKKKSQRSAQSTGKPTNKNK